MITKPSPGTIVKSAPEMRSFVALGSCTLTCTLTVSPALASTSSTFQMIWPSLSVVVEVVEVVDVVVDVVVVDSVVVGFKEFSVFQM